MTRRQFLFLIVPLLVVLLGFVALLIAERRYGAPGVSWDTQAFSYVRDRMAQDCVWGLGDERNAREAQFKAINSWLAHFDGYAAVTPPWDVERQREMSSGRYPGIGIRIDDSHADRLVVTGVKPGGPADKAGLRVGESIVRIAGRAVADLSRQGRTAYQGAIRGPRGTSVRLTMRSADDTDREADVFRDWIDTGTVFGARMVDKDRGIGYLRVKGFKENTVLEFRTAAGKMKDKGLKALVIDLRGNGGGLLDRAVELADLFLSSGVIVRQRGRREEFTRTYAAQRKGTMFPSLPLAIVVDHWSASASEIFASALHDHCRAVLVGEPTYGKFLVQIVEEIPTDAGPALFSRTTSIYETPNGHHYARRAGKDPLAGIPPDVRVPLRKKERGKLKAVFDDEEIRTWNPAAAPVHPEFVDMQLRAAIAVLRGDPVVTRIQ